MPAGVLRPGKNLRSETVEKWFLGLLAACLALAAIDSARAPENQWGVPVVLLTVNGWQALTRNAPVRNGCRYTPTCSVYGELAVRRYGAYRGTWLAVKRVLSCAPWGHDRQDWIP
jgi:uncharacterized protein